MAVPIVYIDLNETVYTTIQDVDASVPAGSYNRLTFGLSDLAELPGQSTWFVNWLEFKIKGFVNLDGVATGSAEGKWNAGIIPRDLTGSVFDDLSDYQDYRSWPLKRCFGWTMCQGDDNPPRNEFSVSRIFRPRKSLVLNREQNIVLTYYQTQGPDTTVQLQINGQFKRGD